MSMLSKAVAIPKYKSSTDLSPTRPASENSSTATWCRPRWLMGLIDNHIVSYVYRGLGQHTRGSLQTTFVIFFTVITPALLTDFILLASSIGASEIAHGDQHLFQ